MRILTILLMACTLSAGHFAYAQEPIYKWGEPVTNDHLDRKLDKLISMGESGFVLLRSKKDMSTAVTYWLESYDQELQLQETQEVNFSLGVMGNSYDIEDIQSVNGKIYVFISHWVKENGKNSLSVKELGMDGELKDIADLDVIEAVKMGNRGFFNIAFSEDGSKLLVLAEMPFIKKTNEVLQLSSYNVADMSLIWRYEGEIGWPSKRARNNYIAVDNNGAAYMFKRIWQKPEWKYALYSYDTGGSLMETSALDLEGRQVEDYKLGFNQNNDFTIVATYTEKPSGFNKFLHGTWFATITDPKGEPSATFREWTPEVLEALGEKNYLKDFHLKDILLRNDGNYTVLLEQQKEEKDVVAGSQPIKYNYTYTYGNFFAMTISAQNGEPIWWQSFKKKQEVKNVGSVDPFGSFVYHMKEDNLYVLWNNTELSIPSIPPANWTEPDGTKYVKHKAFDEKTKHATFLHVIEPDGSMRYSDRKYGLPLFNLHKGAVFEMSMSSPFFFEMNGNLVLMSVMHNGGKRYRFGFISF